MEAGSDESSGDDGGLDGVGTATPSARMRALGRVNAVRLTMVPQRKGGVFKCRERSKRDHGTGGGGAR